MVNDEELVRLSKRIRADVLRATTEAGSGHPGGSLSATDILVTLYWRVLKHDPKNPTLARQGQIHTQQGPRSPRSLHGSRRERLLPKGATPPPQGTR